MTTLYLVRHGVAEEAGEGMKDEERELTEKGKRKFRKAARGFVRVVGKRGMARILTSPLVRARQTAELLGAAFAKHGAKAEIMVTAALGDSASLESLLKAVREVPGSDPGVAAVGHEPTLSEWIGLLCFGKRGAVVMEKGGVAAIRLAEVGMKGELLWLAGPDLLREV